MKPTPCTVAVVKQVYQGASRYIAESFFDDTFNCYNFINFIALTNMGGLLTLSFPLC